ncbi:MAG: prolipoprotein diacylglyceryl transferase [Lentisphaeria bacterium]|nr:prolipoprotein diacylglyceryl transferase [Lentisphaeria bacterium]
MINPVAIQVGPLAIRWYGIFVALGFLGGYVLAIHRAKKRGVPAEAVSDVLFWTMAAGVTGARLFYVIQNWEEQFAGGPWLEVLRVDHGGLVFYGGFFGAMAAVTLLVKIKKLNIWTIGDILAPCVPLGQAFGRVGCLLNGCCHGHPCSGAFAMRYPLHPAGSFTAFPIQAFYSLSNLSLVAFVLICEKIFGLRGRLFGLFMIGYGLNRFFLEFGRGDYGPDAGIGPFTPAQVLCLIVIPAGVAVMWFGGRSAPAPAKEIHE